MSAANRRNTSGLRQVATSSKLSFSNTDPAHNSNNPLLTKEEEYKRLNAELEKKTANLVFEAEQVLKANEKLIHETDYLNRIGDVNFRDTETTNATTYNQENFSRTDLDEVYEEEDDIYEHNEIDEEEQLYSQVNSAKPRSSGTRDVKGLVDRIVDQDEEPNTVGLIPKSANDMSSTAQIRFLKAKLKVMQEEIDRLGGEVSKKDEENGKLAQRCKELDEDRAKQLRIANSHQTQMDKSRKLGDELQIKLNASEIQMNGLKKENDGLKKENKKIGTEQGQLELRLNRALEEIEKYKIQVQKSSMSSKDMNEAEKRRIEQLQSDNKRLQKQKTELIQAFKKQLKLIDILKKQKMHLEAAKILQFSEEEFINALEWNTNNTGLSSTDRGKPGNSQPGSSSRSKTDSTPRQFQRPPSGNARVQQPRKQPIDSRLNNKPVAQPIARSTSLCSDANFEEVKPQNANLMLDNLDNLDDEQMSYDGDQGENYYRMQMNEQGDDFNDNYGDEDDDGEN